MSGRVVVVGLGLIGGSLALAVKARGYDRDPQARGQARGRGIEVADDLAEAIADADLVVAAVPTAEVPGVLRAVARARPEAVLTDVASLKLPIARATAELPDRVRVVGGHPMAGSTARGAGAADAALFRGRAWLVVPTARSDAQAMARVAELAREAGARPLVVSATRHDALMTWVSHLPLVVAAALARVAPRLAGAGLEGVAGPGFADTTRLAATPPALALELALADPEGLTQALEALIAELGGFAAALRGRDEGTLSDRLAEAAAARAQLEVINEESASK